MNVDGPIAAAKLYNRQREHRITLLDVTKIPRVGVATREKPHYTRQRRKSTTRCPVVRKWHACFRCQHQASGILKVFVTRSAQALEVWYNPKEDGEHKIPRARQAQVCAKKEEQVWWRLALGWRSVVHCLESSMGAVVSVLSFARVCHCGCACPVCKSCFCVRFGAQCECAKMVHFSVHVFVSVFTVQQPSICCRCNSIKMLLGVSGLRAVG